MTRTDTQLTEAFHLLMDVRDETRDDEVHNRMGVALRQVKRAMIKLDFVIPNRKLGEGR